ncbi:MAG: cytosolic protein [Chloroflexi bacterium]|nr:cytosolic protein [Chloroflexota bacterium]
MIDQDTARGLLAGAYDMHVHSGPDVLPRKFDDVQLAQRVRESGMAGFVIKNHYTCTADRAALVRELFPEVRAHGSVVLNNAVGGLNPIAVDIAGRLGAKVVWLPTVDSANELENVAGQMDESKLPYWMTIAREMRAMGIAGPWLKVTDADGNVTKVTHECLELIGHHDMILATGHIAPAEMPAVVRAAAEHKVQRIVITHPEFPTTCLTLDEQRALCRFNVFFERCFTTAYTGKVSWEQMFHNIRTIGVDTTILSTDLGQSSNPHVDDGLAAFITKLLEADFAETDIQQMASRNAAQVLGD